MKCAPKRGDIVRISLDPTLGTERTRPALVVSANAFNALGMAMICPITQGGDFSRGKHWTVALAGTGTETQGVILCNQARIVDWKARQAERIESVPNEIAEEVIARLATLLE